MSDGQALATSYLSPSTDSLWRWSGDGEVLTWSDGTTIAFRQEVEHVIGRLAPQGLPPFGAVAMLLAGCRDGWETSAGREAFLRYANFFSAWRTGDESHASQLVFQRVAQGIKQVVEGLDCVSRLDPDVRQTKEAKAVLAEAVFERAKNRRLTPEESGRVAAALAAGVNAERPTLRFSSSEALREFADDADALREGLKAVNEQSLALRRRTGLDELPKEADEDLAPSERVRRLLADLRNDRELAGLARLAQDLMAAVHVPRTLRQQEELPLGGVSDLSNRGPLDRLLVSELAHDDLTLAVRVAVNEALYLRRESPPRQPPNRRAILIDAGIRMWGVPRVFGTAVALALAATADPRAEVLAFRATAAGAEKVDLTTRPGLVAALEAQEVWPHPGGAMKPFLAALETEAEGRTDAILVTHPDVLADRELSAALRQLDDPPMFVATVDRGGEFTLVTLTGAGRKVVREARLSLDSILAPDVSQGGEAKPQAAGSRLIIRDLDPELPIIFKTEHFPLRLPYVADPKLARASQRHGLVAVARDGRLLHWDNARQAARQLTALLPAGRPRGIWIDEDSGRVHVLFDQTRGSRCRLITADLASGRTTHAPVQPTSAGPMSACVRGGMLFLIFRQKEHHRAPSHAVAAFNLGTAAPAGSAVFGSVDLARDRFFREIRGVWRGTWRALAHDGASPVLANVTFPDPHDGRFESPALALFDRASFDGPWAVLPDGRVIDGAGKLFSRRFPKYQRWTFVGVSAEGNRLVLSGVQKYVLDLSRDEDPKVVTGDLAEELLVPQIHWSTRHPVTHAVRTDFRAAFIDRDGWLSLVSTKYEVFKVLSDGSHHPVLRPAGNEQITPVYEFRPVAPPRGMRIGLSAAAWPCGSRVFLDSRGLLHLKSADPALPEVTLVLTEGKMAGWSSAAGQVFGPPQFIAAAQNPLPAEMLSQVIQRFVTRLRRT